MKGKQVLSRDTDLQPIRVRTYGDAPGVVVLLHGGPGAPGYLASIARELATSFRVIEPIQRGSSGCHLTVARHVADLEGVINAHCAHARPALVGHSWGAMLALAYAAAYPTSIASLALIGCGTFDENSRRQLVANRRERMNDSMRMELARIEKVYADADMRLLAVGRLFQRYDSFDLLPFEDETLPCDARAHQETWQDMVRLQREGIYPAALAAIRAPVIMLHGACDPHPGSMIFQTLAAVLPQLDFHEWPKCGHYPWLERAAREVFYKTLRDWLILHSS